jgi:hypothetical protein
MEKARIKLVVDSCRRREKRGFTGEPRVSWPKHQTIGDGKRNRV